MVSTNYFVKACDGKISVALQHMIDGLKNTKENDFHTVHMETFGYLDLLTEKKEKEGKQPNCYGCAATYSIVDIIKQEGLQDEYINDIFRLNEAEETQGFDMVNGPFKYKELWNFELAIDAARQGDLEGLEELFGYELEDSLSHRWHSDIFIGNTTWEDTLPIAQGIVNSIKEFDDDRKS